MIEFTDGDFSMKMDDTLGEMVERMLDRTAPWVTGPLKAHVLALEKAAKADAPHVTGAFRDGFRVGIRVTRNTVIVFLGNSAPHARYVKGRKHGGRSSWVVLVRRPEKKQRKALLASLGAAARSTVNG